MNLLFSSKQSSFEMEYLKQLILSKINIQSEIIIEEIGDKEIELLNKYPSIVIYSSIDKSTNSKMNNLLRDKNLSYSLIHLSDEELKHDRKIYKNADFVLRPFFNPFIIKNNCFYIPAGFQNGYLMNLSFTENDFKRKYTWSFAGTIYRFRKEMVNELRKTSNYFLHETSSFFSEDKLDTKELRNIYSQTIFAPCPAGFLNPDSFRIMETLELGCIPIVKKFMKIDYFKFIFGDHPFIVVNNWSDANKEIEKYLENRDLLLKKQIDTHSWYVKYKDDLKNDISNIYKNNFEKIVSSQFQYQKNGKFNLTVLICYYYWFFIRTNKLYIKINKSIYRLKQLIKKLIN